jgi:hypothetical protein
MKKKYSTNWDTVLYPKVPHSLGHFNVLDYQIDKIACVECTRALVAQGSEICYSFVGNWMICPVCEQNINDAQ